MRIVEWNCQGAFRNKFKEILDLHPDILIVVECEPIEKLQFGKLLPNPNSYCWYSDTGKKGIGIFSFCDYTVEILFEHNPRFRYIVPLKVSNDLVSFFLFAVWAMDHPTDPLSRYIGQVWNAINFYKSLLQQNCLIVGDFNSNKIWDFKERSGNHTSVVNMLSEYQIKSLYHLQSGDLQGEEKEKTFYLHRNESKPYHIDYVFASEGLYQNGFSLSIGKYDDWIDKSDHVPLILDVDIKQSSISYVGTLYSFINEIVESYSEDFRMKFEDECNKLLGMANAVDCGLIEKSVLYETLEKLNKIEVLFKQLDFDILIV